MTTRKEEAKTKKPPRLTVDIRPGPSTPAMKVAWRTWWRCRILSVREELENEGKHEQ